MRVEQPIGNTIAQAVELDAVDDVACFSVLRFVVIDVLALHQLQNERDPQSSPVLVFVGLAPNSFTVERFTTNQNALNG